MAITQIAVQADVTRRDNAAALVGAGLLTVMVFPLLAKALEGRSSAADAAAGGVPSGE